MVPFSRVCADETFYVEDPSRRAPDAITKEANKSMAGAEGLPVAVQVRSTVLNNSLRSLKLLLGRSCPFPRRGMFASDEGYRRSVEFRWAPYRRRRGLVAAGSAYYVTFMTTDIFLWQTHTDYLSSLAIK